MRAKLSWGLVWGAIVMSCFAGHSRKAAAGNCALYARAVTGVDLHGAAGSWWDQAAGRYQRGQAPVVGSILVFRPTGVIPSGHVAVVSKVVGPSMVLVDQSNWYHGRVTLGTPAIDTSPNHDWTTVAVMNLGSGQFGRDNPAFGFVYPQSIPGSFTAAADTGGSDPSVTFGDTSYDPNRQAGVFHFAIANDNRYRSARGRRLAHRRRTRSTVGFTGDPAWQANSGWGSHPQAEHIGQPAAWHGRGQTMQTGRHLWSDRNLSAG
jgi:surface antigen